MSIVKMKRFRMIAMSEERDRVMRLLASFGAAELTSVAREGSLAPVPSEASSLRENLGELREAIEIAKRNSKFKTGLFAKKSEMTEKSLFASETLLSSLEIAERIKSCGSKIILLQNENEKLTVLRESLMPWKKLDVPLETRDTKSVHFEMLTFSAQSSFESIKESFAEDGFSHIELINTGRELHYAFLLCHKESENKIKSIIKSLGGQRVRFRSMQKTPAEEIRILDGKISENELKLKHMSEDVSITEKDFKTLLAGEDILTTRLACAEASENGAATQKTIFLEGWIPAREEKRLSEILDTSGCAYEFSDPAEGETPPTLTYNNVLIRPFEVVTNMYSAPAYTGVDPNPIMAPFFAIFFGIMLSDAGYGILLALVGAFALIKLKPRGGLKSFMQLAVICGISTVIWGALFGGFFGDAIPSIYKLFTGNEFGASTALWFDPLEDPMKMLFFSLILGGIQIVAGMAVKAYMMIRDGEVLAAIFDIGFWWVTFAGAIVAFVGDTQIGLIILAAGAVGLVLTQGREKKNVIMKFFGGVLSLYDVTSYFSDLLSYSRLLALSLSTAVVGKVINTMGGLMGPVGFFLVFIIGHVFSIAINLIGSFVHSARLQYVEFYGKFYEGGGEPFAPLCINTKNIEIVKEEN